MATADLSGPAPACAPETLDAQRQAAVRRGDEAFQRVVLSPALTLRGVGIKRRMLDRARLMGATVKAEQMAASIAADMVRIQGRVGA